MTDEAPTSPALDGEEELQLWRNRAVEFWSDAVAAGQRLEEARMESERLQAQATRLRGRLRTAQEERRRLRERARRLEARVERLQEQLSESVDQKRRSPLGRLRARVSRS